VKKGGSEDILVALSAFAEGAGQKIKPLLTQLSKDYGSFAQIAGIAANPDNPNLDTNFLTKVIRGRELYENKDTSDPNIFPDKRDLNPKIIKAIGAPDVLKPEHVARIQEVVKYRFAAHKRDGGGEPGTTEYKKWVHLALGGHIDENNNFYGGVTEFRGQYLPIPNSVAQDANGNLEDVITEFFGSRRRPQKIFLPHGMPHFPDENGKLQEVSEQDLLKNVGLKPTAKWTDGLYYLTNRNGEVFLDKTGKNYAIINLKARFGLTLHSPEIEGE
jgi:hypothetical protein